MITNEQKQFLSLVWEKLADEIGLTPAQYALANEKTRRMAEFLTEPGSLLMPFSPEILLQGSLRNGIAVRPINEEDEFDVDLTCKLLASLSLYSQADLRRMLKTRLEQDPDYRRMLDDSRRRCLREQYAESMKFHMDIVPATPDDFAWVIAQGVPRIFAQHALNITDTKHQAFLSLGTNRPKSNTEGFALWLAEVMQEELFEFKRNLSAQLRKNINDIADYEARTTLQRVIQILKRHRDVHFQNDCDDKPVSIIITTLAARAYRKESNLYDALTGIILRMPSYIEKHLVNGLNESWVPNPVNPEENFADKWKTHKQREQKFYSWLQKLRLDLNDIDKQQGLFKLGETLRPLFGTRSVNAGLDSVGKATAALRENGKLTAALGTATLGVNYPKTVPNHIFHGSKDS